MSLSRRNVIAFVFCKLLESHKLSSVFEEQIKHFTHTHTHTRSIDTLDLQTEVFVCLQPKL